MRLTILLILFSFIARAQFYVFDMAPTPEPVSNNAVCGVGTLIGEFVYSFGGIDSTKSHSGIHLKSWKFDVMMNLWTSLPSLPDTQGKIAASASEINNIIYIIGGYHVNPDGSEVSSNKVHRFDPSQDAFLTDATPIPTATDDHVQMVWRDSLIFVVSGWSNTTNINLVQIFNPSTNSWTNGTSVPHTQNYKSFGASGVILGDTIYYYGGASSSSGFPIQDEIRIGYINPQDPTQITWSVVQSQINGYRTAAGSFSNKPIWIGGSSNTYNYNGIAYDGSGGVEPSGLLLTFDPASQSHQILDTLDLPMDLRGAYQTYTNNWIIVGGMDSNQTVSNRTRILQYWNPFSIDEEQLNVSIYPNPVDSGFRLAGKQELIFPIEISILDINGKMIHAQTVEKPDELINTKSIVSGSYLVTFNNAENQQSSIRLIVQH